MNVQNLNGTGAHTCKCGSWIAHWKKYSKTVPTTCARKGCPNKAEYGGHVQKVNSTDKHWYIIPLCPACNNINSSEKFELKSGIDFVSANVNLTCGK